MGDVTNLIGVEFQGWAIQEELGRGDSAIVYSATKANEKCAIKFFFPEALSKHGFSEEKERLELQLRLRGSKLHQNLVAIHDGGYSEEVGTLYLVMENVPGRRLDDVAQNVPRTAIASLLRQLAAAAQFLDQKDLVHRDIKPANIVVSEDFAQLTLLDVGILQSTSIDAAGRLSGLRFVATARYSPPEFVWRTEIQSADAWRAVTFYQIGGVLHDLIMRKRLFAGNDEPPAVLFDSIRMLSPEVRSADCEEWLCTLAKSCLIKDWRERLRLVNWDSFAGAPDASAGLLEKQKAIRLKQIRRDEELVAKQAQELQRPANKKVQDVWQLQDQVFLDTRRFLTGSQIFPRFSARHVANGATDYNMTFTFEKVPTLGFEKQLVTDIGIGWSEDMGESVKLHVKVTYGDVAISEGLWMEPLGPERAAELIQGVLLDVTEKLLK